MKYARFPSRNAIVLTSKSVSNTCFGTPAAMPPLVTSGSLADLMPASLGQTNTRLLFGGNGGDAARHNGGRLTLAYGIDEDNTSSVTGSFFVLDRRDVSRGFGSDGGSGTPVIGRPFFNVVNGTEDADPVAVPNLASGRIAITTPSMIYGGELDYRYQAWKEQTSRFDLLVALAICLWMKA